MRSVRCQTALARTTVLAAVILGSGCEPEDLPRGDRISEVTVAEEATVPSPDPTTAPSTGELADDAMSVDVLIDATDPGRPIDPRVFGTNVPAWLGAERLRNPAFVETALASGTTLVRMPGGRWANGYSWLACELGAEASCAWPWAARPSDFVEFLEASGLPGMWTVSINETANSAAALVAFFNGTTGDDRVIGFDRNGIDWGTVGRWAELRAAGGHPDPVGIQLWEVGNEVFAGTRQSAGDRCSRFGWEEVWTCDGAEYVEGTADHDGYLVIREAMLAVDPTIEIGAVGTSDPAAWGGWGGDVIDAAGDDLDFYVVHEYPFGESPDPADAIVSPSATWPRLLDAARRRLGRVPIAVTEHNLVSFEAGDTDRSMTLALNGLFVADTLGQLIEQDVTIANFWNLANGTTTSGSDFGLVDAQGLRPFPAFEAFRLWKSAGPELLPVLVAGRADRLRVYPTRRADGTLAIIVVNVGQPLLATIGLEGFDGGTATTSGVATDDLEASSLDPVVPSTVEFADGELEIGFPQWSITVVEVEPDGSGEDGG